MQGAKQMSTPTSTDTKHSKAIQNDAPPAYGAAIASSEHRSPATIRTVGPETKAPLPRGWEQFLDPTTGREYYHNRENGLTTWERPAFSPTSKASSSNIKTEPPPSYDDNTERPSDAMKRETSTKAEDQDRHRSLAVLVVYGEARELVRVQFGLRLKNVASRLEEILAERGDAADDETFVGSVKFFCPGYGFADAHTILGDELTAAFDTDRSKEFDLAVCLVPNNVVGDKLCNDLDAIASEARRIGKRIKERNISNLAAQERITQLLLRLDSVVTTPTTRPLRRMQVRQLLALSRSISSSRV